MSSTSPAAKDDRNGGGKRALTALVPGAVVAGILIAGCGGSASGGPAPDSTVTHTRAQFVGYAVCMRSHGVAGYPDPQVSASANGVSVHISPGGANPDSPGFRSADRACHGMLPNGGAQGGPGHDSAAQQREDVVFADCMRSHGAPSFPDPGRDGVFTLPATVNDQAPAFLHAMHACQKAQPSSLAIDETP